MRQRCITGLKSGSASRWFGRFTTFGIMIAGLALTFHGQAQALDCAGLRNLINSTPVTPPSAQAQDYAASAEKQRLDIERTRGLLLSLHCDNEQFLFFGKPRPAQCDSLQARLAQMEANKNQLERAAAVGEGGQRAEMIARYQQSCMEQQHTAPRSRGFFDALFGGGSPNQQGQLQPPEDVPIAPDPNFDDLQAPHGGSQAICVKTADGSFFPVSYATIRKDITSLTELCRALCPASEVRLYTWNPNGELKNAMDAEGNSYSSLPNALKFETRYVPEASCKPSDRSWAQVLGPAEQLLGMRSHGDLLVTPQKAAELSRAKAPLVPPGGKKKAAPAPAGPDPVDAYTASLAAAAAANTVTSGIGSGTATSGPLLKLNDGEQREITGPDGIKHKVRIIAPTL